MNFFSGYPSEDMLKAYKHFAAQIKADQEQELENKYKSLNNVPCLLCPGEMQWSSDKGYICLSCARQFIRKTICSGSHHITENPVLVLGTENEITCGHCFPDGNMLRGHDWPVYPEDLEGM